MKSSTLCPQIPKGTTVTVTPQSDHDLVIPAALLACGELVAFPTETVYGLGAAATNPDAVAKIFEAKGRPSDNPLIVHVAQKEDIPALVREVTPLAQCLMDAFMPGPITLVMPKSDVIPDLVSAGLPTVGIRMPDHPLALKLIRLSGVPVAAPSANVSGSPSPTRAEHVVRDLYGRIACIVDGGACEVGIESSVVDVTGDVPVILRPGAITMEMLIEACQNAGIVLPDHESLPCIAADEEAAPKSPGMKYRHYAPKAHLRIVMPDGTNRRQAFANAIIVAGENAGNFGKDSKIGVFCGQEEKEYLTEHLSKNQIASCVFYVFGKETDISAAAHSLFDGIRSLDQAGVGHILAAGFVGDGLHGAYMNRLEKAAADLSGLDSALDSNEPAISDAADVSPENMLDIQSRKILFVCTGNTCRSPMAEGICNRFASERGPFTDIGQPDQMISIIASSSGIYAENGSHAEKGAVAAVKSLFDIDLTGHRSRKTTEEMISENDIVFAVTREHAVILRRFFPELSWKIESFSEYMARKSIVLRSEDGTPERFDIPDPFGQNEHVYEKTARILFDLIDALWPSIVEELGLEVKK
jgi:tRNA threonylcarbamoyl adenosine modification protein (Sua5/YciO/YrdC/YwlC family)